MLNFILDNVASQILTFSPTFIWLKNTVLNNICLDRLALRRALYLGDENGKMILLSQNEKSKLFLKGLFNKFEAKI
jgi:hypothetical protein